MTSSWTSPRSRPLLAAVWLANSGCGAEFDSQSEIDGLRVLAIQKSSPYLKPGEPVELTMLWHDSDRAERVRTPQIAWISLCENPPGDLYEQCLAAPLDLSADDLGSRISLPDPSSDEANDRFAFTTSPDLVSSRPPPKDPGIAPYGLNYVFFAACAGEIDLRADAGFPFPCYEESDGEPGFGAGDPRLGSRDFVVGYSAVYAYEELANQNPIVHGFQLDDMAFLPEGESGAELGLDAEVVQLPAPHLCVGAACLPPPALDDEPCPEVLTLPVCAGDCPEHPLKPLIDPRSAEVDEAASSERSGTLGEQMWVNYYAAGGEVAEEVRLLNDATVGWNPDFETDYVPAKAEQVSYVWAVAHDNRGGTQWARLRLCTAP